MKLGTAVTGALHSSDMVLTARAGAPGYSAEARADAGGFIKAGSFNLSAPLCLYSGTTVSLSFTSCVFSFFLFFLFCFHDLQ